MRKNSRKLSEKNNTLMQVQSENGSVMTSSIPAKNVRTNAQNPGPSGSAVIERKI